LRFIPSIPDFDLECSRSVRYAWSQTGGSDFGPVWHSVFDDSVRKCEVRCLRAAVGQISRLVDRTVTFPGQEAGWKFCTESIAREINGLLTLVPAGWLYSILAEGREDEFLGPSWEETGFLPSRARFFFVDFLTEPRQITYTESCNKALIWTYLPGGVIAFRTYVGEQIDVYVACLQVCGQCVR
jgi:hypothetical protein